MLYPLTPDKDYHGFEKSTCFFARQDLLDEFNPLSKTMLRTCLTAGYGIYVHVIIGTLHLNRWLKNSTSLARKI